METSRNSSNTYFSKGYINIKTIYLTITHTYLFNMDGTILGILNNILYGLKNVTILFGTSLSTLEQNYNTSHLNINLIAFFLTFL